MLRATTTAVYMAAPVRNILDTPAYVQYEFKILEVQLYKYCLEEQEAVMRTEQ
jgi:hypothetical protein